MRGVFSFCEMEVEDALHELEKLGFVETYSTDPSCKHYYVKKRDGGYYFCVSINYENISYYEPFYRLDVMSWMQPIFSELNLGEVNNLTDLFTQSIHGKSLTSLPE